MWNGGLAFYHACWVSTVFVVQTSLGIVTCMLCHVAPPVDLWHIVWNIHIVIHSFPYTVNMCAGNPDHSCTLLKSHHSASESSYSSTGFLSSPWLMTKHRRAFHNASFLFPSLLVITLSLWRGTQCQSAQRNLIASVAVMPPGKLIALLCRPHTEQTHETPAGCAVPPVVCHPLLWWRVTCGWSLLLIMCNPSCQ